MFLWINDLLYNNSYGISTLKVDLLEYKVCCYINKLSLN
jgi:hypothetical protein